MTLTDASLRSVTPREEDENREARYVDKGDEQNIIAQCAGVWNWIGCCLPDWVVPQVITIQVF